MKRFLQIKPKMPNPLILLAATLILMAWGVTFEASMNDRREVLHKARTAYLKALTTTRTQLSGLVAKIASDATLQQNLKWRLSNSVNSRLKIHVQKGVLDQVHIWDANCKAVASAHTQTALPTHCPRDLQGRFRTNAFSWSIIKDAPTLSVVKGFKLGRNQYYVSGLVQLDQNWVNLQGELKMLFNDHELYIGPKELVTGTIVIAEGKTEDGKQLATLGTTKITDKLFGSGLVSNKPFVNPFFWPTWILTAIFSFMVWWQQKQSRQQDVFERKELIEWCKSLSPIAEFSMPGRQPELSDDVDLRVAQRYVSQALQTKMDALRGASRKREDLQETIKALEVEIQSYQQRLAELAELDSLAIQLQRTTGAFLEKMANLHDRSEDLSDTLDTSVAENSQTLHSIMTDWQRGLSERGSRKFIRSLAETASNDESGDYPTLLDEQVHTIISLTGSLRDGALNASINANELVEIGGFASRMASLWHGLALSSSEEATLDSVVDGLEESQDLIHVEEGFSHIDFRNLLSDNDLPCLPKVPKTIWVSAIYHIYLGLAEQIRDLPGFCIVSRLRIEESRNILAISLAHPNKQAAFPESNERQAFHLDIARAMLTPFHIKLIVLPVLNGPFPIALSWTYDALPEGKPAAPQISSEARPPEA